MFAALLSADYEKYAADGDLGPFIEAAKADHDSAIVCIIPSSTRGNRIHAVFFKNTVPAFYAAGGMGREKATAETVRKSLTGLPAVIPAKPHQDPNLIVFMTPGAVMADNGVPLPVSQLSHTTKDKLFLPDPETGKLKPLK